MLKSILPLLLLSSSFCFAQKKQKDTIVKYLDYNFRFTTRSKMTYPAMAVRSEDHWLLVGVYPDTSAFIRAYFKDEDLQIKDGPFQVYHPKGILAAGGKYIDNIKQGAWVYYFTNGAKKDSGCYKNNHMVGEWKHWNDNGELSSIFMYPDASTITDIAQARTTNRERKNNIMAGDTSVSDITGTVVHFYPDGNMIDSGRYQSNKETGYWKLFYKTGGVESSGFYRDGVKFGEWEFFRRDGTRSTKEKYINNTIVALECFDEQGNPSGIGCPLQKPPVAQGPFLNFEQYALNNMFWPEGLKDVYLSGRVNIEYTITKEGKLTDLKIISSPHPLMSAEVKRFFQSLEWSPAVSHNRTIDQKQTFSVPFYR